MDGSRRRKNWSEDETVLAFYYYRKIPFGQIGTKDPDVVRIASLIGRTPSAVARKMFNLAHFDPEQQRRNVSGLSHASKTDAAVVARYLERQDELTRRAVRIEADLTAKRRMGGP